MLLITNRPPPNTYTLMTAPVDQGSSTNQNPPIFYENINLAHRKTAGTFFPLSLYKLYIYGCALAHLTARTLKSRKAPQTKKSSPTTVQ